MTSIFKTSQAARKITHTYGKRGSRSRNGRSASAVSESSATQTQENTEEGMPSIADSDDEELPPLQFPAFTSSSNVVSAPNIKARSLAPRSFPSTSRVPEVVIYSPAKTSSRLLAAKSDSNLSSNVSASQTGTSIPKSGQATDKKGKGRMVLSQQEETSSSESETIKVATTASDSSLVHHLSTAIPDLIPSTIPKLRKRRQSSSPENSPNRRSKQGAGASDSESGPVMILEGTIRKALPQEKKEAAQAGQDTIDTLFDDLLSEAAASVPKRMQSTSQTLSGGRLAQMSARPADEEFVRPCLSRSPSLTASPVRLHRASSWSQAGSPESRSGSPFQKDHSVRGTGGIQRTQSASTAFQDMLAGRGEDRSNPEDSLTPSRMHTEAASPFMQSHLSSPRTKAKRPPLSRASSLARSSPQHSQEDLRGSRLPMRHNASYDSLKQDLGYAVSRALSEDEEDDSLDDSGILHSVNQLRSAGENRRFTDEMHYLLEGFDTTQSLGIQRTSAIEILKKVGDDDFCRKLKIYDFVPQVYAAFRTIKAGDGDMVLDITLLLFLLNICTDKKTVNNLMQRPDQEDRPLLSVIGDIRDRHWIHSTIEELERRSKKTEKRFLASLAASANQTRAFIDGPHLHQIDSLFNLSNHLLMSISSNIDKPFQTFAQAGMLKSIFKALEDGACTSPVTKASLKDLQLLLPSLHLFEKLAMDASTTADGDAGLSRLTDESTNLSFGLGKVVEACVWLLKGHAKERAVAMAVFSTALKIIVTLTDASRGWSDKLADDKNPLLLSLIKYIQSAGGSTMKCEYTVASASSPISQSSLQDQNAASDVFLLALSVLETVLEYSPSARKAFRFLYTSDTCITACFPACLCHSPLSATHVICRILSAQRAGISQDEAQIYAGYASLIIIYATLGSKESQQSVFQVLKAGSNGLEGLHTAVKELLKLHQGADKIGVDASQTSESELRAMLEELNRIQEY